MASDKAQIVFMVDTSLPKNAISSLEQYYRSLCLATLRILLYLSQFPIREHLNRVVWNFKLFNSERAEKSAKTWQFHENRSEHIERFFQQLQERLKQSEESATAVQLSHARHKSTTHKPIRLVYNTLAAVIQDFIWDAPEIMSPIRPMKRGRVVRSKAAAASTSSSSLKAKESDCDKNMVIILSSCPANDREMRKFCYGPSIIEEGSQVPVAVAMIAEQLLPPALLTQLSGKGITVHWVHTGGALIEAAKVPPGLSLMSDVLKKAGGALIPLTTLVTPLAPQLKIQNSPVAPQLSPAPFTAVEIGSNKISSSCSTASPVDIQSVGSIDSELMHPPSLPKIRPSSLPSRDLLSSLVLPPPALLKEYLPCPRGHRGRGSGSSDRPLAALKGNNLLWFSTRDGNVLFIVEVHPMCRLLTPNLTTRTTTMTDQTATRHHSTERGGRAREREGQGAATSRRILLRKKLSFSKALKNNSESSSGQEDTQISEADSHSTFENAILHSTPSTCERIPPVVSSCTPSPSMVAIGLVRQSDLPLSWLDPTSVFSCNGLYVPRDTRNSLSHSLSSRGNSIDGSPEPSGETSTSKQSPPCPMTSASLTSRTPTYLGVNISPVVRLNRCIPGSSHFNQSMSRNRRKRTSSVPKDVLCSLSKEDSTGREESKENKTITDKEKMIRIKSSRSLPSSPVVLCNKLPLLRGHHSSKLPHPPLSLALPVSPQLLQRKMTEVQRSASSTTENECKNNLHIHPEESLHKSGRYCSRQYQNLCLWLAKNSLLLVVKVTVEEGDGGSWLGVLQPVTSLVSTVSLLKPQHHGQLLKKLINPPPSSSGKESTKTDSTSAKLVPVSLKSKRQLPTRRCRTASQVLQNISQPSTTLEQGNGGREEREASSMEERESCLEGSSGFMASCASDSELYAGLQLLFRETKSEKSLCDDSVQSCLLSALADAPPFTHLPLLPWFPYSQLSSINSQDIERLQELHLDIKDSEYGEIQRKSQLLAALKEVYSCGHVAAAVSMAERESLEPSSPSVQDQPVLEEIEVDDCTLPNISSTEELYEWFLSQYEEQVKLCQDGDSLLRWCTRTLAQFHSSFIQLELPAASSSPSPSLPQDLGPGGKEARLWEVLHSKGLLLSNKQLGDKYEKMAKDKMEGVEGERSATAAAAAAGEMEGEREREGSSSLQERKITEHLLQILLHFESLKLCSSIDLETKREAANTLVILFRKLSLLANPGLVGSCLKKIILPVYLSSCQDVLTEVYTQLMLPLPSDLSSSPDRPLSPPDPSAVEGGEGEEGESSEEWTPLASLEEPPGAPKQTKLGLKRLARHTSFHDNQSHRQITVMNKKTKRKRKRQKPRQKLETSDPPRRSPRIAKMKLTDLNAQQEGAAAAAGGGRSVCRSLFSRSMSVSCEVGSGRKREREEDEMVGGGGGERENQLAKRRKSIHSLQRHHTVVEGASLFKSPRKSFYSGTNVPRRVTTPLFKTPPLKENTRKLHRNGTVLSPRILLNKEPSPAAIYSLLHGNMVSPQDQQNGNGSNRTPRKSTKDVAIVAAAAALTTISPRTRGKLERTPESKGQSSRDLSFTPLGHRGGGGGLASPRDLSLMLSPGVLASYLVSNTPSSLARSVESRSGTQLTTSHCALTSCDGSTAVGVRRSGFKSARTLTYENEDPLRKKMISSTNDSTSTTASEQPPAVRSMEEERASQRTSISLPNCSRPSRRVHGSSLSPNSIFLISPPNVAPPPLPVTTATGGVCLLTDLDPSIENESASMMAFALSTPTKDDPRDFLDAFD